MGESELSKIVGANVRRVRELLGKTQQQISDAACIAVPHISRLEAGGHLPSLKTLNRVADALGVDLCELVKPPAKRKK